MTTVKLNLSNPASIQAFEREIMAFFKGAEEDIQKQVVAEVNRQLGRVRQESRPSGWVQWIDGVKGAPIEHIRFNGIAHFRFSYLREIVQEALVLLGERSPVKTGRYQQGHVVLVDDEEISDLSSIPYGATVIITDRMTYARKIEEGKRRDGQPWSTKAPNGVYRPVASYLSRKWSKLAKIKFTFRPFAGLMRADESYSDRTWAPAIVITPKWEE